MNENQKKVLFWVGIIAGISLIIFLLVSAQHTYNTAATTNTVSFSGEGKVTAKPDISVMNFTIETRAADSKTAQDSNTKKSNAVVDYLKQQGVEDKDVKTSSYFIQPEYGAWCYYPKCNPERPGKIIGYIVNQGFEVKIRDLTKVSIITDGVVTAGANRIDGITFTIEDTDALKAKAREEAIKKAKQKAVELEQQVGIDLGKIVNFSESGNFPVQMAYDKANLGIGGGGGAGPSLPTGENDIVVDVTITYQIK
ncbi:MAG: hypothetical protein CEN90_522 [Parcubacteria group bacterium Licking1014_17]|nr:MAG: hypothetical protein CEN90_522 [Parcubacteria group bacterium Licking1014_17]